MPSRNKYYQLGAGTADYTWKPVKAELPEPVKALSMGSHDSCAITQSDKVLCWGGYDETGKWVKPAYVSGLDHVVAIDSKGLLRCVLTDVGKVSCWGDYYAAISDAPELDKSDKPLAMKLPEKVDQIAVGSGHACAGQKTGRVWCWGYNHVGQMGNNQSGIIYFSAPQEVIWSDWVK